MSERRFVVIDIGCLECGNPSNLLGAYPTLAAARAAHPHAEARADVGDDGMYGTWHGESIEIIFDLGPTE